MKEFLKKYPNTTISSTDGKWFIKTEYRIKTNKIPPHNSVFVSIAEDTLDKALFAITLKLSELEEAL